MHPRLGVLRSLVLAVGLCLLFSGVVDAGGHVQPLVSSASISPSSQTVTGISASWTGQWTGTPPFSGYFIYRPGVPRVDFNTSSSSKAFSYSNFPWLCTTETYTQTLWVSDDNGGRGATSTTTVLGKHPC